MTKRIIAFFMLCVFISKAQNNVSQVLANMAEQEKSWNKGSIAEFMAHYWQSDSLMFIGSKGITYGWQHTFDNYIKSYPDKKSMGILHFNIIYTKELSPNSIFLVGKWQLMKEKPAGGHFTLLWQKINGRWYIVADHTS